MTASNGARTLEADSNGTEQAPQPNGARQHFQETRWITGPRNEYLIQVQAWRLAMVGARWSIHVGRFQAPRPYADYHLPTNPVLSITSDEWGKKPLINLSEVLAPVLGDDDAFMIVGWLGYCLRMLGSDENSEYWPPPVE